MDISVLKPSERMIEIHHPGDETKPLGIKVTLLSLADERMKGIRRRIQNDRLKLQERGKGFKAEDIEDNSKEIAFSAMVGWSWEADTTFNGEKPNFTKKDVLAVFNALPWFLDQVNAAIGEEKDFFPT